MGNHGGNRNYIEISKIFAGGESPDPPLFFSILSRASEVGSPTNHLGSRQRQDTDQGAFTPPIPASAFKVLCKCLLRKELPSC